jgi:hypothetical protein
VGDFQRNDDYQEVADRIVKFYEAYPEGRLTSEVRFEVLPVPRMAPVIGAKKEKVGDKYRWPVDLLPQQVVVVCTARAYRTPDDPIPCVGIASEPYPGLTPYTEDSEAMNAETSAWGRAIVATGCTGTKKIASANEVRGRQRDDDQTGRSASRRSERPAQERRITTAERPPQARTEAPSGQPTPFQRAHAYASERGLTQEQWRDVLKKHRAVTAENVEDVMASVHETVVPESQP